MCLNRLNAALDEWHSETWIRRDNVMLRMIIVFCLLATTSIAQQYNYDVEGYDYNAGGYVYGEVDADSYGNVSGYIYLDDGTEVYVDGQFDGYGEMEVYGDDGNYYELEVD